jgi:hypothetical protein
MTQTHKCKTQNCKTTTRKEKKKCYESGLGNDLSDRTMKAQSVIELTGK